MHGPEILVRSLALRAIQSKDSPNLWQYHSRSDRHSKIACWGILFDLLLESSVLRQHFAEGLLAFGVNHQMRDFRQNRKKDLDLVLCTPGDSPKRQRTFGQLAEQYELVLDQAEQALLAGLPVVQEAPVGMVRMALEAKACMTEHIKALPRLHDELNSSHLTIHGSTNYAIAVGFAMVNIADTFVSSDRNKLDLSEQPAQVTTHDQPRVARRVIEKLQQVPRRTKLTEEGFEAFGVVLVDLKNDGSFPTLVRESPAPQPGDIFEYSDMIRRAAGLYASRYK